MHNDEVLNTLTSDKYTVFGAFFQLHTSAVLQCVIFLRHLALFCVKTLLG